VALPGIWTIPKKKAGGSALGHKTGHRFKLRPKFFAKIRYLDSAQSPTPSANAHLMDCQGTVAALMRPAVSQMSLAAGAIS
jgi:hypothetical protein